MKDPRKDIRRAAFSKRQSTPATALNARSRHWTTSAARIEPKKSQDARKNYEQYLALARAEAQVGNTVGAENYYQHAEHYLRSLSSGREGA
jgi:hypothetical protein